MNDFPAHGSSVSLYREVTRTFTYGMYATVLLLLVYEMRIPLLNDTALSAKNTADNFLENMSTLFGLLPSMATGGLLVMGAMWMLYYERKKYGFIQIQKSFFLLTFNEALGFGLVAALVPWFLHYAFLFFNPQETLELNRVPLSVVEIFRALGVVYEEILFRVILLGGSIALFRFLKIPVTFARIMAIAAASMLSSATHYVGHLAEPLTLASFLYKSYLGVFFSYIYLWRGFATVAWSHVIFNIVTHIF